ncbi:MAG: tRNA (adenosine(37)-N6)-threonylcarbamoyltransferase complex dimerization subunit type 1 TsaB [Mycoplasmataceae bacterium]|nr:tRNA (adenosine(37)-N6)-threonylcarbamoyltransferase complex dimerization subunit type 1 TsaB [Mycoplasmataceae bacterium]
MKILIDTVNKDLFISLINNGHTLSFLHLKDYKYKSDMLPAAYKKLLEDNNLTTKDIKEIYVVNGPGSFMGIRAGIVFSKTLAFVGKKKLFQCNNLKFISGGKSIQTFVDAKSGVSFRGQLIKGKYKVDSVDFQEDSLIDYDELVSSPNLYLDLFDEVIDILNFKEEYFKEPRVGGA